jgi:hypothetical protein
LYNTFKESKLNFLAWNLSAALVRRIIIGFGQHSGLAQNILLLLFELVVSIGQSQCSNIPAYAKYSGEVCICTSRTIAKATTVSTTSLPE